MKLARRITLYLVLCMTAVLALDAYLGVRREAELFESDLRQDLLQAGETVATAAALVWSVSGEREAQRLIVETNTATDQPDLHWVDLAAPPASPLAPHVPATLLVPAARLATTQVRYRDRTGTTRWYTYVPIRVWRYMPGVQAPRGGSNIVLELSTSLAPERRYVQVSVLHRALTALMLALLCALIAIGLGALFIGRPMRLLVEKARRVGAGDFSGPLRFPRRDELHELAEEMNATCEQLAEAERRVAAETEARLTALEELRHADRLATVGRLAAGVAHELGTPLNVVTERAKLIASGQTRGAEVGESAGIIVAQGQRITAVVRQLLDFARRSSAEKNVADLRDVVHATRTLLDPLADRRGVVVREVLPGEPVPALLHAPRMEQALTNLVMNALQATPRGGMVEIALDRVRAQPPIELGGPAAEHLWLRVRDEGAGVPPQDLPHVFEPFFTTKAIGQGTGLGLAVAYGIVREHGGWMDVESSATGSCFSIYLPPAESLMGAVTGAAGG